MLSEQLDYIETGAAQGTSISGARDVYKPVK